MIDDDITETLYALVPIVSAIGVFCVCVLLWIG